MPTNILARALTAVASRKMLVSLDIKFWPIIDPLILALRFLSLTKRELPRFGLLTSESPEDMRVAISFISVVTGKERVVL